MAAYSVLIGSAILSVAGGARIARRTQAGKTLSAKYVAGVPIFNYELAYQGAWRESMLELQDDQESWLVQMHAGITQARLEKACSAHSECVGIGSATGNPFLELMCTEEELQSVLEQEGEEVDFVEPIMPIEAIPEIPVETSILGESPWGLRRIRSRTLAAMPKNDVGKANGGKGVHVYVLDTGVRTTHNDFGGRAIPTVQVTGLYSPRLQVCKRGEITCAADKQGHGTHCAGTIGGTVYGVAKAATLHAVKVLGDDGRGSNAGISKAIDWVANNHIKPAVASMSLGGSRSASSNEAANSMVRAGVIVVTASGNSNTDSCTFSPGSASLVINVGSIDPNDKRSSFSNYGKCMAIWAPGRNVLSAGHKSDGGTLTISGTSMACPHVSGAAALILSKSPQLIPAKVKQQLLNAATPNVVTDAKSGSPEGLLYTQL